VRDQRGKRGKTTKGGIEKDKETMSHGKENKPTAVATGVDEGTKKTISEANRGEYNREMDQGGEKRSHYCNSSRDLVCKNIAVMSFSFQTVGGRYRRGVLSASRGLELMKLNQDKKTLATFVSASRP